MWGGVADRCVDRDTINLQGRQRQEHTRMVWGQTVRKSVRGQASVVKTDAASDSRRRLVRFDVRSVVEKDLFYLLGVTCWGVFVGVARHPTRVSNALTP